MAGKNQKKKVTDELKAVPTSQTNVRYDCGHEYAETFKLDIFGDELELTEEALKVHDECGNCLAEKIKKCTIRCSLCGRAIFPGEEVALYDKKYLKFKKGHKAVNGQIIGCMRWECCPSGAFLAGAWDGEKFVPLFKSGLCAAAEALATGQAIAIVGD
jgi:hypothetical protein